MEESEFSATAGSTATALIKPTTEITKIMSNELLKIYELNEYCNFIESDLEKWYKKVEMLTSAKIESSKILADYKNRIKISAINSESLLQALNELYKYKSELKATYIAAEKAVKMKKLKYKKIINSYEAAWDKALKEYSADAVFMELNKIQEENGILEIEIEKQEKLNACSEIQLSNLKGKLTKTLRENTVEFAKAMLQYKHFFNSTTRHRKGESQCPNQKENFQFKLFTTMLQHIQPDNNDEGNYSCNIDVSVFDKITVPTENLEEEASIVDVSKEQDTSEYLNSYPQITKRKTSMKENFVQMDDNESHYFRAQPSETSRQPPNGNPQPREEWNRSKEKLDSSGEKLKSMSNAVGQEQMENGEESARDMQMECEESASDGSYEKQMGNQRADDTQCHKTSSASSEDFIPPGENFNENVVPGNKAREESNKCDLDKNEFKGFTGFFSMGNDPDTSKPSIFKLF